MREAAHERFEAPVEQLVLIFGGRILKDPDNLQKEGKKYFDVSFMGFETQDPEEKCK